MALSIKQIIHRSNQTDLKVHGVKHFNYSTYYPEGNSLVILADDFPTFSKILTALLRVS